MAEVTLSASSRTNLLSLQSTKSLIDQTQSRLSTGVAIATPMDDAVKYFQAKSLNDRARDISERKDAVDQGVSALGATLNALSAVDKLVSQIKAKVDTARTQTSATDRSGTQDQIAQLVSQIQKLIDDANYKGMNLLNNSASNLTVRFSEKSTSKLSIDGLNFNASAFFLDTANAALNVLASDGGNGISVAELLGFTANGMTAYDFTNPADLGSFNASADTVILRLEATVSNLRAKTASMATNNDILKVRIDFSNDYVNTMQQGADKLTLADLNTESANMLALQTRQQLGVQALSFAGQSEQAILSLFR